MPRRSRYRLNDAYDAPLPRDLRLLISLRWRQRQSDLAKASGVGNLNAILCGRVVPTADQVRRICRALGIGLFWRRVLAFGLRWENSDGYSAYLALAGYQDLLRVAKEYGMRFKGRIQDSPRDVRSGVAWHWLIVVLGLAFDSIAMTFDHDLDMLQFFVRHLGLNEFVDRSDFPIYRRNYRGLIDPATGKAALVLQFDPNFPKLRTARLWIADIEHPDLARAVKLILGVRRGKIRRASNVRVTRYDLHIDYANGLETVDLVMKGRLAIRTRFRGVLQQASGARSKPILKLYDNRDRGGGFRCEYRFRPESGETRHPLERAAIELKNMALLPNPFRSVRQWDLRTDGIVDPGLLEWIVRAQECGAGILGSDAPPVLRERRNKKGEPRACRLQVRHDPCHPAQIWERDYVRALRRLAKCLGLRRRVLGLRS